MKKIICTPIVVKSACPFRIVCKAVTGGKKKVVVLLVRQLQHGFTKNAKVSPNLTVTHIINEWQVLYNKNQVLIVSKVGLIVIRRIQAVMVIGKKQKLQISMLNCNVTDPRPNA